MQSADGEPEFIQSSFSKEDVSFEISLRPQSLDYFLGQEELRERLQVFIGAAKQRKEALGHTLFCGPPGLGKTTLANIVAKEMEAHIVVTSGPVLDKPADLAGLLTNLKKGDILFIDEIHRLNRVIEEYLYPAMEDFVLDLLIDSGPHARSVQVQLEPFTLIGATTRMGLLTSPLRSRFYFTGRLDYYSQEILTPIILGSAKLLQLAITKEAALEIAARSRGTPRIANNLLKWARDFVTMKGDGLLDKLMVNRALEMLSIDEKGLDEMDKKILRVMIDHYDGGPVGLNTLAVAIGEEGSTIEEVYEPYLITQGFLKRTPRGREATPLAYQHMNQ